MLTVGTATNALTVPSAKTALLEARSRQQGEKFIEVRVWSHDWADGTPLAVPLRVGDRPGRSAAVWLLFDLLDSYSAGAGFCSKSESVFKPHKLN